MSDAHLTTSIADLVEQVVGVLEGEGYSWNRNTTIFSEYLAAALTGIGGVPVSHLRLSTTELLAGLCNEMDLGPVSHLTSGFGELLGVLAAGGGGVLAPVNSVAPALSGTVNVGQTLTCSTGTWSGEPTFAYQWYRSITSAGVPTTDADGNYLGNAIGGATSSTYELQADDRGELIFCDVTATNDGGSTVKSSDITVQVWSAETAQYLARVTVSDAYKLRYSTMIDSIVSAGVWAKLGCLYRYDAASEAVALINLKSASSGPTDNGDGLTFTAAQGFTAIGGGNALTVPHPAEFTQNSASFFAWTTNTGTGGQTLMRGSASATKDALYPAEADGHLYMNLNSTVDDTTGVAFTVAAGMHGGSRTNDTLTYYQNGANKGTRADTSAAPSGVFWVQFNTMPGQLYGVACGQDMTDANVLALHNAMAAF